MDDVALEGVSGMYECTARHSTTGKEETLSFWITVLRNISSFNAFFLVFLLLLLWADDSDLLM